ncbi:MAG: DUF4349 domain-containing protein [Aureispira sp.]|nr:DUF4349 domain-containing protein [Aureispira sp.]
MGLKKRVFKAFFWLVLLFAVMLIFRLIYGYYAYPEGQEQVQYHNNMQDFSPTSSGHRNIASAKYEFKKGASAGPQVVSVDQKYEKTANLQCKTSSFEEDEKKVRTTIKEHNAIIQFQQESGSDHNHKLYLQIGVQPDRFDQFITQIRKEHNVVSINTTKKDKTNEYRELNAKIATLQTTRASLVELKSKGGQIEEYINLENRILDIDEQLQSLGVQMGNFDSENEFCTVNILLQEQQVLTIEIGVMHRLKVAIEWTIKYYLFLMVSLCFALIAAYVGIKVINESKILYKIKDKLE